jgi:cold shock CspA family protein
LFPERGYGFLTTSDGREVYFHQNSVLGNKFKDLKIGTEVRFVEEPGDKGPQASTVRV